MFLKEHVPEWRKLRNRNVLLTPLHALLFFFTTQYINTQIMTMGFFSDLQFIDYWENDNSEIYVKQRCQYFQSCLSCSKPHPSVLSVGSSILNLLLGIVHVHQTEAKFLVQDQHYCSGCHPSAICVGSSNYQSVARDCSSPRCPLYNISQIRSHRTTHVSGELIYLHTQ